MKRALLIVFGLLITAAGLWSAFTYFRKGDAAQDAAAETHVVVRGPLETAVSESATLQAERSVNLGSKLDGRSTIVWVVPEGTSVKKGDPLLRLDTAEMKEKEENQRIAVSKAEADLSAAEKERAVQESKNASELSKAENAVVFARLDQCKFLGTLIEEAPVTESSIRLGEKQLQITKADSDIALARKKLLAENIKMEWTRKLHESKYVSDDELRRDESELESLESHLKHAENSLFILKQYTLIKQERELELKFIEAQQECERAKLRGDYELVQRESLVAAKREQLNLENEKLKKYLKQIEGATVIAPNDGIVVYRRYWDQTGSVSPREGLQVNAGNQLITLPDLSTMEASTFIREAQMDRVKVGQSVTVRVDAFPDLVFNGEVRHLGVIPSNSEDFSFSDTKTYSCKISLSGDRSMLRPGQAASIQIHVAKKDDVLSVPVQSVQRKGRVTYVWKIVAKMPHACPVKTGLNNDRFVEITEGLSEGDVVTLACPPEAVDPEFTEIEREIEERERATIAAQGKPTSVQEPADPKAAPGEAEGLGALLLPVSGGDLSPIQKD